MTKTQRTVKIGQVKLNNRGPVALIAGPCVIESERFTIDCARALKKIASRAGMPFIFKSSFDKFTIPPEEYYLFKRVRVKGLIKEYKNKPEIIVEEPSQIEIIK